MKTFEEWLKLQEGGRLSGLSYGGRSLADKYGSYRPVARPKTDDLHPTTGMLSDVNTAMQREIIQSLERNGLTLSRDGDRFVVKNSEGDVEFESSGILDLQKTLRDAFGSGDEYDVYHPNASIRAGAVERMRRKG